MPVSRLTMEGLSKIPALGFSIYPITILVWESKGPNWKGRTEKAAPVSKRKFTSLPSICRVTQGSRGVIWTSPFAGVSRATGHRQTRSPRTSTEGAGVGVIVRLPLGRYGPPFSNAHPLCSRHTGCGPSVVDC